MGSPAIDGQAGPGEAAVDHVGPVLDLLQLALDDAGQAVQVGGGEAGDGPLEQRPDALSRFAAVPLRGSDASSASRTAISSAVAPTAIMVIITVMEPVWPVL